MLDMSAGHFIFIPAVLLFGLVLGWILGSRAAADAYAAEFKRREERAARAAERAAALTNDHRPARLMPCPTPGALAVPSR